MKTTGKLCREPDEVNETVFRGMNGKVFLTTTRKLYTSLNRKYYILTYTRENIIFNNFVNTFLFGFFI